MKVEGLSEDVGIAILVEIVGVPTRSTSLPLLDVHPWNGLQWIRIPDCL